MINNNMVIMPKTYEELTHQAQRIMQCKRLLPNEKQKYSIAEVEAIIQIGQAYGLSPWQSMQAIMIVNGQASVWGDFLIGLAWASGKIKEIKEYSTGSIDKGDFVAICEVKRGASVIIRKFSIDDAKKANLWGRGPIWKTYPKRMLQMRARSWAIRDGFGDVTKGLIAIEEAVDYKPLDDTKPPNEVEQEIIKTIAEEPELEEVQQVQETKVESAPTKVTKSSAGLSQELIVMTYERLTDLGLDYSLEETKPLILGFLEGKSTPLDEISNRALNNFEVYFDLLIKHINPDAEI